MLDVVNYYEQLVIDHLHQLVENEAEPVSLAFLEDVACLALNTLPPCYVRHVIDKSASLSEQDLQNMQAAVSHAIEQAIAQVRSHPHDHREGGSGA